ncbi:ATP-binding cassette domain-containing protein [Actinophytocola gossypii]|uniref:ATP-binding cassette domain-containing protein n=1 Tax=Actinophytocola gossypii TaxID=2812003 RepID=A0ABT2JH24_9PSEU|nr:ATP-binding cassette domain-containing protein [Actinophytocola gossypii]MCT2587182.1 ATP-binding cassette domain-containing protein [Actinophytocola gossypii]
MSSREYSILAEGLHKRYGRRVALHGLDLAVRPGTVHGLLGPNGAGKTTAVRILCTLLAFDGGEARVCGLDVRRQARAVRGRIGLTGQNTAIDDRISARGNLVLFGRLFHLTTRRAKRRADELLERFGLSDVATVAPRRFSGGMRRRLDLAASMILAPDVLFLDEPTTGLDPRGRMEVWAAVRELTAGGTTVLLTTHYLDEADRLSDRISVVDRGRKVIDDTPAGIKRTLGGDRIEVVAMRPDDLTRTAETVARVTSEQPVVDAAALRVHAPVDDRVAALTAVATLLQESGIEVEDIGLRRPTLDEAFVKLTGHGAEEVPA